MSEARSGKSPSRGRLLVALAVVAGLALATGVAGLLGFHALLAALERIGWRGLAVLSVYTAFPFALLGGAWYVLTPALPVSQWGLFVWARVVRDAATEILPFSQVGGFVIGARTAVLHGLTPVAAASTTVVDVTAELIAQVGFTGLGLALLATRLGGARTGAGLVAAGLIGVALSAAAAVALVVVQRRGGGPLEALARRFFPGAAAPVQAMRGALDTLYAAPLRLGLAVIIHLAAWVASAAGVWLALGVAGVHIFLPAVLALEALVAAVRGAAFVAPMGLGVQEAAYATLGPVLGLPADLAVALSLVKRGRDLVIGVPALLIWQAFEGRRVIARNEADPVAGTTPL